MVVLARWATSVRSSAAIQDARRGYAGKRLPLKVIEADQRRDRLSLSEGAAATAAERGKKRHRPSSRRARFWMAPSRASPSLGQRPVVNLLSEPMSRRRSPRVTTGIESLIHISEIASRRIATPAEVVQPGDLLRVRVVAIDPERRRLSLSIRQAAGNVMYATRTEQDAYV